MNCYELDDGDSVVILIARDYKEAIDTWRAWRAEQAKEDGWEHDTELQPEQVRRSCAERILIPERVATLMADERREDHISYGTYWNVIKTKET